MNTRVILGTTLAALVGAGLILWTGCGDGHDHSSHSHDDKATTPSAEKGAPPQEPAAKPYPLKTCVVSGDELGKMGQPKRIVYEGQEVKFCCPDCEKDFRKDPAKFLKKIEEGRKGS
jgi:YHS domain-containing protein